MYIRKKLDLEIFPAIIVRPRCLLHALFYFRKLLAHFIKVFLTQCSDSALFNTFHWTSPFSFKE